MKYPRPLQAGSRIAVSAFSAGVRAELHPRLDRVLGDLRTRGFEVIEGQCLRESDKHVSAPKQARADELMAFLLDDSIDAIAPPWGGELAMELLPLLDYASIAKAKPKWLFGFSDVSTITAALAARCGWATVHCGNLMDLSLAQTEPLTRSTLDHLALPGHASFTQYASERVAIWPTWQEDPDAIFGVGEPTRWRCLNRPQQGVSFSGRLLGGCLDILQHLFETPYLDFTRFKQQHAKDGVILYLENCEMSPPDLARALLTLQFRGVFEQLNGLMLGRDGAKKVSDSSALSHREAVQSVLENVTCPVLVDVDLGHVPPNLTLINGALAHVTLTETAPGVITQTLS